jgi:hypothetical protein
MTAIIIIIITLRVLMKEPRYRSRYSDCRLNDLGGHSSSPGRVKNVLFSISFRRVQGPTQPPIQWGPGVKLQGREADHSPPTSAVIKKAWIYLSTPPYVFMA